MTRYTFLIGYKCSPWHILLRATHCRCPRCLRAWARWPAPGGRSAACSQSPASSRTSRVSEPECRPGKTGILFTFPFVSDPGGKVPHQRFEIPWLSEWRCLGEVCEGGESSINHYWKQILWREKAWESDVRCDEREIVRCCDIHNRSPAASWWRSRPRRRGRGPAGRPPAWPPSRWAPWGWPARSSSPRQCSPGETWTRNNVKCQNIFKSGIFCSS